MKGYEYVSYMDFYPHKLKCLYNGVDFTKKSNFIVEDYLCLDTETSKEGDEAWLYQWMFSYPALYSNKQLVYGRKPSQLADAIGMIKDVNRLYEHKKIVIYTMRRLISITSLIS